jgi:hypothetical protein
MNNEDRIIKLEKKVKTLETINFIRFTLIVLTFVGLTAYFTDKLKTVK